MLDSNSACGFITPQHQDPHHMVSNNDIDSGTGGLATAKGKRLLSFVSEPKSENECCAKALATGFVALVVLVLPSQPNHREFHKQ